MRFWGLMLLIPFFWALPVSAQKEGKVYTLSGTFMIEVPPYMSMNQAKQEAIRKAQNQAIDSVFGSTLSTRVSTVVSNKNGKSDVSTRAINEEVIKGIWLGNLAEPKISQPIFSDGKQWLEVTVKGRARKLTNAGADFEALPLYYQPEKELKTEVYKSGQDFFLYFKSPTDGYLNVFIYDITSDAVVCLLPYQGSGSGSYAVTHDEEYYFFSPQKAKPGDGEVNEVVMTCSENNDEEMNELYVGFSPEYFSKGISKIQQRKISDDLVVPPAMGFMDFNDWLIKNQAKDEKMQVLRINLLVKKQ